MKNILIIFLVILVTAVTTWSFVQTENIKTVASNPELVRALELQESKQNDLENKINNVATQLGNIELYLSKMSDDYKKPIENNASNNKLVADRDELMENGTNDSLENQLALINEGKQKKIKVDMTPKQYESFHVLEAKMNDPGFISTVNLADFSSSEEIRTLPEPLAIALISQLVKKFNEGKISKDVFLGKGNQSIN